VNYLTVTFPQTASILVEGQQYRNLQQVYLSSSNPQLFPTLCAVSIGTTNPNAIASFPPFYGYPLESGYYFNTDDNHLYISLPSLEIPGVYDVILYNVAGYSKLSNFGYLVNSVVSSTVNLSGLQTIGGSFIVTIKDPLTEITLINR